MVKKTDYTVLIISGKNFERSYSVNRFLLVVVLLFIIAIISFSALGILRISGKDDLYNEVLELRDFAAHSMWVIKDLDAVDLVDIPENYEIILKSYYSESDTMIPMAVPVSGYVTQGLMLDSLDYHPGVDIAAKAGDLIRAPADGLVVFSGRNSEMGNLIILAHDWGFFTVFGHNDTNLVFQRDLVSYDEPIARVGGTGMTEGPHLHFEIWKNDQVLDPRKFIDEYNRKDVSLK